MCRYEVFYASVELIEKGLHPLKHMLVVMSKAENTGNGLVLSASPLAKKTLGISNVSRANEVPDDPRLLVVPPRMNLYIAKNLEINNIFRRYIADEDLVEYSIDESLLYLTPSLNYFGKTAKELAKEIQRVILDETGLYCTVGLGDNPLLAKVSMDIEAKHNHDFFAEWRYKDVPEKLWPIKPLSEMWGIGSRYEKRLNRKGILSVKDLAAYNPYFLKQSFGVMGEQLYAHAWGIDRTSFREVPIVSRPARSYGNSQVLPRNYTEIRDIKVVLREITEQVASRLRRHHAQTKCVHLFIGNAYGEDGKGFSHQKKIPLTNQSKKLIEYVFELFNKHYKKGTAIRHIGVTFSQLEFTDTLQLSLFEEPEQEITQAKLDSLIDQVRFKYGFSSLIHASSLLDAGTAVKRSSLVGGHAGGMEGINQQGSDSDVHRK